MATGAAIACPDRKVINLQADGSGLYTAQALWTQARENLDVLTLVWANRSYAILKAELANVGANPGRKAIDMLTLDEPAVDWVSLARGFGVEAVRAGDLPAFLAALRAGLSRKGPFLVEVQL
jgi:acetolactate synthase-1/2/3 large subunit